MTQVSFYTTVLRPDDRLTRTHESLPQCGVSYEHVVTVARDFDRTFRYLPRPSPTLKVISTPDASLGAGWNAALRECEGAYLMVANGGDAIVNVKPLVEALDRDPNLDFAYGDIRIEDRFERGRPGPVTKWDFILHGMYLRHGAIMMRRDFHQKFGPYSNRWRIAVDFDMMLSAVAAGARMAHVDAIVAAIETPGLSRRLWERTIENYRIVRRQVPWLVAFPIACKWLAVSFLHDQFRRR